MSARRDPNQGHGFVYVDIPRLLKQAKRGALRPGSPHPQEKTAQSFHFPKRPKPPTPS